ncbi:stage V sporulation protein AB [Bacillus ectoiniformans]|nr:stage V sporulation protein AB [Bacillus ectoiniformans]
MKTRQIGSAMAIVHNVWLAVSGLAGGLAVGAGFVAFITVLGLLPRLMQLTKTNHMIRWYEWAVITGVLTGTFFSLFTVTFSAHSSILIPAGFASGMFIGMLAAALTEVLNVFPILAKRIGVHGRIIALMMAIALGKVAGSLFHWLYFVYK